MPTPRSTSYTRRDELLLTLGYRSYNEYLESGRWRAIRAVVLLAAGNKCCRCGRTAVRVHHSAYDRDTLMGVTDQLHAVCEACHDHAEFRNGEKTSLTEANVRLLGRETALRLRPLEPPSRPNPSPTQPRPQPRPKKWMPQKTCACGNMCKRGQESCRKCQRHARGRFTRRERKAKRNHKLEPMARCPMCGMRVPDAHSMTVHMLQLHRKLVVTTSGL